MSEEAPVKVSGIRGLYAQRRYAKLEFSGEHLDSLAGRGKTVAYMRYSFLRAIVTIDNAVKTPRGEVVADIVSIEGDHMPLRTKFTVYELYFYPEED